jgi:hypothetical protein
MFVFFQRIEMSGKNTEGNVISEFTNAVFNNPK